MVQAQCISFPLIIMDTYSPTRNAQMGDIFIFDSSDISLVLVAHAFTLNVLAALYVPSAGDVDCLSFLDFVRLL